MSISLFERHCLLFFNLILDSLLKLKDITLFFKLLKYDRWLEIFLTWLIGHHRLPIYSSVFLFMYGIRTHNLNNAATNQKTFLYLNV